MNSILSKFDLTGKTAVITGGAGFLGIQHAEAVLEVGGIAILWDIDEKKLSGAVKDLQKRIGNDCHGIAVNITDPESVDKALQSTLDISGKVDILINNAANDPKFTGEDNPSWTRFENFPINMWYEDMNVGLTGAFICSQRIGIVMVKNGGGVILNISSDLGIIAPDQGIYRQDDLPDENQPVKPVTYSVTKHGIIGLTKYLATYWSKQNIRVNALSPGGVHNNQPDAFVNKLTYLIPMGRMAHKDEYKAAVIFLVSDASSYMTGANLIIDGGRTCW